MRKVFILLQIISLHFVLFSQSSYNLKFDINEFSLLNTEKGYQIQCKNTDYCLLDDTTLPALPYKNIYILIPENTNIENVTISFNSEEIRQDIFLINNPIVVPASENKKNPNSSISIKSYPDNVYPNTNLKFETVFKLQGFYIAAFSVCPFIYHAQKQILEFITEMNISFDLKTITPTYSGIERYDMEDIVSSLVINPEEMDTLYPQLKTQTTKSSFNDVEYLIITSENLKDSFNPLKSWKIRKGIKTEIITTDYIYSNYVGNTNQIKIKKCLQDYYQNRNLKWVLLGGDNTIIPVQMCYYDSGGWTASIPCDLYYACFDNAFDWDANGNSLIGEISDDIDLTKKIIKQ